MQLTSLHHTGCYVSSEARFDYLMLVSAAIGLVFFYAAPALSSSIMFRLSCGSAIFTAGSLLVMCIFLFR